VDDIKIRKLGWAGYVIRMKDERLPEKVLNGKLHNKANGENKKKTGRRHPEGYITGPTKTKFEEKSRRVTRTEASSEGGQGPEEAKAP
jgi:hypothetical protein